MRYGGRAGYKLSIGYIGHNRGSGSDHGTFTDFDVIAYADLSGQDAIVANDHAAAEADCVVFAVLLRDGGVTTGGASGGLTLAVGEDEAAVGAFTASARGGAEGGGVTTGFCGDPDGGIACRG
jgi:hypothetical protein